jgi:hypothetical protein
MRRESGFILEVYWVQKVTKRNDRAMLKKQLTSFST